MKTDKTVRMRRLIWVFARHTCKLVGKAKLLFKLETETALLKVQNDFLQSLDQNNVTVLVMLDLSAAFDTVDHKTLLHRLGHIEGWAQDYSNSNIFLKPLFRGNLDPFVNNANLGAIAHTSNGTWFHCLQKEML